MSKQTYHIFGINQEEVMGARTALSSYLESSLGEVPLVKGDGQKIDFYGPGNPGRTIIHSLNTISGESRTGFGFDVDAKGESIDFVVAALERATNNYSGVEYR